MMISAKGCETNTKDHIIWQADTLKPYAGYISNSNFPLQAALSLLWESEIKRGSLIQRPFRPYPTAMPVYDALDGCQADPGALEIIGTVKTLKNSE
jgi:hypothetical protein